MQNLAGSATVLHFGREPAGGGGADVGVNDVDVGFGVAVWVGAGVREGVFVGLIVGTTPPLKLHDKSRFTSSHASLVVPLGEVYKAMMHDLVPLTQAWQSLSG